MKQLWAPWRMEYIGGEQPPGCLFCRVIQNRDDDSDDLVLWRPAGAIVMLNKFPYNPGHAIVAPHKHTSTFEDLDDALEEAPRFLFAADVLHAPRRPQPLH